MNQVDAAQRLAEEDKKIVLLEIDEKKNRARQLLIIVAVFSEAIVLGIGVGFYIWRWWP